MSERQTSFDQQKQAPVQPAVCENRERGSPSQLEVILNSHHESLNPAHISTASKEALALLEDYAPKWRPQEQMRIVIWPCAAGQASYVGKWEGKHHLLATVSIRDELQHPAQKTELRLRLAHEMMHQRFAELIGVDDPNSYGIDRLLSHEKMKGKTDLEQFELIYFARPHSSPLQKMLNEGVVLNVELELYEVLIDRGSLPATEEAVVVKMMMQRLRRLESRNAFFPNPYFDGFYLLYAASKAFPGRELADLVIKINWERCGQLELDTKGFQKLVHDPRQIPGLENV